MAQVIVAPEVVSNKLKIVTGEIALDGTNPTPLDLSAFFKTKIVSVDISIRNASAPALGLSTVTYDIVDRLVNLFGWEPTGAGDTTLVASSDTETIAYTVVGF